MRRQGPGDEFRLIVVHLHGVARRAVNAGGLYGIEGDLLPLVSAVIIKRQHGAEHQRGRGVLHGGGAVLVLLIRLAVAAKAEIAQRVERTAAVDDIHAHDDVRMVADDQIRPSGNRHFGEDGLRLSAVAAVLLPAVEDSNDCVRLTGLLDFRNLLAEIRAVAIGVLRVVVVPEQAHQADGHAVLGVEVELFRFGVAVLVVCAKPAETLCLDSGNCIAEALRTVVERMVVCQRRDFHARGGKHLGVLRRPTEPVAIVAFALVTRVKGVVVGQHALQIDDGQVILGKEIREVFEEVSRAFAVIDGKEAVLGGAQVILAAKGDVAGEGEGDGLLRQRERGEKTEKQQQAGYLPHVNPPSPSAG